MAGAPSGGPGRGRSALPGRTEWVFDKDDYSYLGSRVYRTKDAPYAKAGALLHSTAEIDHAIVDKAGQVPVKVPGPAGKQQAG
ncbi:hypothetical protein ACIP6I_09180 [Streptomyces anulatus]